MNILLPIIIAYLFVLAASSVQAGVTIGLGMDYTPIARMRYVNNADLEFEIFDNVAWQGQAFYEFGNGLRVGNYFALYQKRFQPSGSSSIDLSQWSVGILGDYGYEITDSGSTRLVGGMETGYGELTDQSATVMTTAGSIWVAGIVGVRFKIAYGIFCELDYRLIWLEYDINSFNPKKYLFSGSSLRLALEYPILTNDVDNN
jgi:hypothetical protein